MLADPMSTTQVCHCCKRSGTTMHWKQFPKYSAASCIDTRKCQLACKFTREQVVEMFGKLPDENKVEVFVLYHTGVVYQSPPSEAKHRIKKFLYGPVGSV